MLTAISSLMPLLQQGRLRLFVKTCLLNLKEGITYMQVENSAAAAGLMAHNFFGQPSEKMKLVGVTGTNGKTTIVTLLYKFFTSLGYTCGLLSTVQNHIGDKVLPATHTTPDPISLNQLLHQMVECRLYPCVSWKPVRMPFTSTGSPACIIPAAYSAISPMITWIIIKHLMNISG